MPKKRPERVLRARGPRSAQDGFTLMELIVASLLTSIVLGGVYAALSSAIVSWHTGEAGMRNYQGARISMAMLEEELQCVIPGAERLFEGDKNSLSFYAVARPMDVEKGRHVRIMRVTYRLKDDAGTREKTLVREEAVVTGPFPTVEPSMREEIVTDTVKTESKQTFEMAAGVRKLEFSYYWIPPPTEEAGVALSQQAGAPIVMEENRRGWGQPQGIKIVLVVADPNDERGESVFTSFVAFQGPSTVLKGALPGQEEGL